ncbi:STY0301 family protein [Legionella sp. 227]|uniref:STY0301 family protein n=1 Tax=Legionella sp. 227 TaxID=3367288 RepID=UPI00370DA982
MRIFIWINFFWGCIVFCDSASATAIHCPETIQTTQSLQHDIKAWEAFQDDWNSTHHFDRVTFYSGHPKEQASLAPDTEVSKVKKLTWSFDKQEIWVACEYTHTKIQLIQKIPHGTESCSVTYNENFSKVLSINCT